MRKALNAAGSSDEEAALKAARNYGGSAYAPPTAASPNRRHQHFGSIIVSCDHADLRPMPDGVMIYDDDTVRLEKVAVPPIPRSEVIDEFCAAVVDGKPPLHDGEWSRATLEVCLAIRDSAQAQAEIMLRHQVGFRGAVR
jgi:phthalate 4,5-cis-dihydrodiol dehydrogenase